MCKIFNSCCVSGDCRVDKEDPEKRGLLYDLDVAFQALADKPVRIAVGVCTCVFC